MTGPPVDAAADEPCADEWCKPLEAMHNHHRLLAEQISSLHIRVDDNAARLTTLAIDLQKNTIVTERVDRATAGVVSTFDTLQQGMKVLGWLGVAGEKILKAGAPLAILYGLWVAFKTWVLTGGGKP